MSTTDPLTQFTDAILDVVARHPMLAGFLLWPIISGILSLGADGLDSYLSAHPRAKHVVAAFRFGGFDLPNFLRVLARIAGGRAAVLPVTPVVPMIPPGVYKGASVAIDDVLITDTPSPEPTATSEKPKP